MMTARPALAALAAILIPVGSALAQTDPGFFIPPGGGGGQSRPAQAQPHPAELVPAPRGALRVLLARVPAREQDGRDGGDLLRRGAAGREAQGRGALGGLTGGHSGMFPCFLVGIDARLSRRARRALSTCTRVSDGEITAST